MRSCSWIQGPFGKLVAERKKPVGLQASGSSLMLARRRGHVPDGLEVISPPRTLANKEKPRERTVTEKKSLLQQRRESLGVCFTDKEQSARVLNDVPSAEAFIQSAPVTVVGFLQDLKSLEAEAFSDVAQKLKRLSFAVTYNTTVWEKFNISRSTITLFKEFDEGRADYAFEEGHLKPNVTKIIHFLRHNELRLVTEYNPTYAGQIFGSGVPTQLLLLVSKTSKEYQPLFDKFKGVAPEFLGKVIFVLVNTDKKENRRVTTFFKVKEPDLPAICLFHVETNAAKAMKVSEISPGVIRRFYTDFIGGIEEFLQDGPSRDLKLQPWETFGNPMIAPGSGKIRDFGGHR
ncbi:endoplasmic reticulum resident protein 27 [Mobula hypostoma]|uniref:endoplasmic reticulum resident protein 27 n=1 Tax=Mobula hypostoma TaxID=723540 RepID=UPI002FC3B48E